MATAATASAGGEPASGGPPHGRKSCLIVKNRPWRRRSLGGGGGGGGGGGKGPIQFAPLPSAKDVTADDEPQEFPPWGSAKPTEREASARLIRVGRNRKLSTSRAASIALGGDALTEDKFAAQRDTYYSDCFESPPASETSGGSSSGDRRRRRHSTMTAFTGTTGSTSTSAASSSFGAHHSLVRTSARGGKRSSLQLNSLETICSAVRSELRKEELEDSFRTMLIKRGIQKSRARMRVGGKRAVTPYEVDAERRKPVFKYNKNASSKGVFKTSSHTLSSSTHGTSLEGLTVEEQMWVCIERLLADAFSADESVPPSFSTGTSSSKKDDDDDLANVLPPKLVKAMSRRSSSPPPPLQDTSNERTGSGDDATPSRRHLFQRGPPSQILLRRMESVGDITVDEMDELEMAAAAIKTFEAFFVPEDDDGAEVGEDDDDDNDDDDAMALRNTLRDLSSRDLAMPPLEPLDGPRRKGAVGHPARGPAARGKPVDLKDAEGVLDSFMDALLMSLEKDLEAIEQEMDEEQEEEEEQEFCYDSYNESGSGREGGDSRLRMKDSALTLFDVFQWSVDVNMRLPRPPTEVRGKPRRRASAFT